MSGGVGCSRSYHQKHTLRNVDDLSPIFYLCIHLEDSGRAAPATIKIVNKKDSCLRLGTVPTTETVDVSYERRLLHTSQSSHVVFYRRRLPTVGLQSQTRSMMTSHHCSEFFSFACYSRRALHMTEDGKVVKNAAERRFPSFNLH